MLLGPLATLTTDIQSPNSSISIILPALLSYYYYNYLPSFPFSSQSILNNLVSCLQTHVFEAISYCFDTSAAMATALDPHFHQLKLACSNGNTCSTKDPSMQHYIHFSFNTDLPILKKAQEELD